LNVIKSLRAKGIPVLGYTWFPLFTMIDWRYRYGRRKLENYRMELGLYQLGDDNSGPRWKETPLVSHLQQCIENCRETVGELKTPSGKKNESLPQMEIRQNYGKNPDHSPGRKISDLLQV
jgi:hypothetical protein